jgi:hypothetical protein
LALASALEDVLHAATFTSPSPSTSPSPPTSFPFSYCYKPIAPGLSLIAQSPLPGDVCMHAACFGRSGVGDGIGNGVGG